MIKKILRILKWTGLILLAIIAIFSVVVASRQNLTYDAPYPNIKASTDSTIILRGKELVFGPAHCADCHAPNASAEELAKNMDVPLTGGFEFSLGIANIFTRNITPDKETGIGNLTDGEIARALRYGVKEDGTALFDFMPFHNTSDEDLTAIISYIRAQKPVHNPVPENRRNIVGNVIQAFLIKPVGPKGNVVKSIRRDSTIAYGEYLTNSVANCVGCHTPRDMMTGAFIGPDFSGGMGFKHPKDPDKITYFSPNLTPDKTTGRITNWTQDQFVKRFKKGKLLQYSEMPWNSFSKMSENDLKAIYKYLHTLKPVKHEFAQMSAEEK
ncbi:MAG: c-type cytochrome [Bacteroidota bacterium]